MMSEFIKERKQGLQLMAAFFFVMLAFKFGMPASYEASKFKFVIDLWLIFGVPVGVLWELYEFRKNR